MEESLTPFFYFIWGDAIRLAVKIMQTQVSILNKLIRRIKYMLVIEQLKKIQEYKKLGISINIVRIKTRLF